MFLALVPVVRSLDVTVLVVVLSTCRDPPAGDLSLLAQRVEAAIAPLEVVTDTAATSRNQQEAHGALGFRPRPRRGTGLVTFQAPLRTYLVWNAA